MLVVTDLSKLENYGFKDIYATYNKTHKKDLSPELAERLKKIHELLLYDDDDCTISILVNEFYNINTGEIQLYYTNNDKEFDQVGKLDILFDMIKDGVVIKK